MRARATGTAHHHLSITRVTALRCVEGMYFVVCVLCARVCLPADVRRTPRVVRGVGAFSIGRPAAHWSYGHCTLLTGSAMMGCGDPAWDTRTFGEVLGSV